MLWDDIEKLTEGKKRKAKKLPVTGYGTFFLFEVPTDSSHWLVGPYHVLTDLATDLRTNEHLRDVLTENEVRLGLRASDKPPADVVRQARYGSKVAGEDRDTDFTGMRVDSVALPAREVDVIPSNRRGDRETNVKTYWDTQTPQSHHIVEFNNLEMLGKSTKEGDSQMDYLKLPAVLLAAEFHQRYITAFLRDAQRWSKTKLQAEIVGNYQKLYTEKSALFNPLWDVSAIILRNAGLTVP